MLLVQGNHPLGRGHLEEPALAKACLDTIGHYARLDLLH